MKKSQLGLKNDKFRHTRGGKSRLLSLACSQCQTHFCNYQKDGPGDLKRLYLDRMLPMGNFSTKEIKCSDCKKLIGVQMIYEKENRPAIRLIPGALAKKIAKEI